jgi:phage baseplate assembly protein V
MDIHERVSFLEQKIDASIQIGTIDDTKAGEGKALARVKLFDRVTDFLPVLSIANSFVKVWIPPRVGEQVMVVSPYGNPSAGFIIPAIFNKGCKEPSGANENNVIVEIGSARVESDGSEVEVKAPTKILLDTPVVETTGDLKVAGDISDSRGDLTGHTHSTTDGATAKAR